MSTVIFLVIAGGAIDYMRAVHGRDRLQVAVDAAAARVWQMQNDLAAAEEKALSHDWGPIMRRNPDAISKGYARPLAYLKGLEGRLGGQVLPLQQLFRHVRFTLCKRTHR